MKLSALLLSLPVLALAAPQPAGPPGHPNRGPLVSSASLRRQITRSALLRQAEKLESFAEQNGHTRAFGSKGHMATINYIASELRKTGYYDVSLQPFTERYAAATGEFKVDGEEVVMYGARGSPSVDGLKAGLAAGKGEGCNTGDFGPEVKGKIALVVRGNCTITYKSQMAGAAGAKAVLIYNSVPGTVLDGRLLDEPGTIPTGAIGKSVGEGFLAQLAAGEELSGELSIEGFTEERVTYNVIAETKGGDKNKVVVVGGHSDSVPLGPGINDNGSGSIGLLEVALKLTKFKVNNAIRFIWFSAEEFGLLGAHHYVKQLTPKENLKIALMTNVDMIASPNYILGVYDGDGSAFGLTGPPGSAEIEHLFEDYFRSVGRPSVPTAFTGRSDYGPFLDANIPAGGLFTGAEGIKTEEEEKLFGGKAGEPYDENYHQPGDGVKNLDLRAQVDNTKAIAHLVAVYGKSLKGFPKRTLGEGRAGTWSEGTHGKNHDHSAAEGAGGCGDGLY